MSICFWKKSHFFNKNWKKNNGGVDVFGLDKKCGFDQNLTKWGVHNVIIGTPVM